MTYYLTWFLAAFLYSPIFYQLYQSRWERIDYTHAYFILPVSLWAAWQKRQTLRELFSKAQPIPSSTLGLTVLVTGLLMFIFGWRQNYLFICSLSLIPVSWGTTRYLYGRTVARALMFPFFYILFLIPPPLGLLDAITMPMRYGISSASAAILKIFGYPVSKSGLMLTVGGHEIFMGAPCSGFRSLITMFALAVAYVYFIKGNRQKKLILIPSVLPFALFGNLVRVITLCLVTFYLGQEAAEGFFHEGSGAVIFLIMISCLMGLEHIIDKAQKRRRAAK